MTELSVTDRYLRLGLRFDRIESGFVDAYFGDPAHRRAVEAEDAPEPARLAGQARALLRDLEADASLSAERREFLAGHVRALECSARRFDGAPIGFVDEVRAYFDVDIAMGDTADYEAAHAALDELLDGSGPLQPRMQAQRERFAVPTERVPEVVEALAGGLREIVRGRYGLPEAETVAFEIERDKPWSGFNYYLGGYRSRVAINGDLPQYLSSLPHLIAHEAYPGHHTEHCRKEQLLVRHENGGVQQAEQTIFLVNTPQCLMAEGLADHALHAALGPGWGRWAQEIYADLGLAFDGDRAERIAAASSGLLYVRQDAALMLHDRHASEDDVAAYLQRWGLMAERSARQALRFVGSPLWRAYISTYVEGYALLGRWLGADPEPGARAERFGRLLDEPLTPSALRRELAA